MLKEICVINTASRNLLKIVMGKLNLPARAYDRILKVSRTIVLQPGQMLNPSNLRRKFNIGVLIEKNGLGD